MKYFVCLLVSLFLVSCGSSTCEDCGVPKEIVVDAQKPKKEEPKKPCPVPTPSPTPCPPVPSPSPTPSPVPSPTPTPKPCPPPVVCTYPKIKVCKKVCSSKCHKTCGSHNVCVLIPGPKVCK